MLYRNQVEMLDCGISVIQAFHKYYYDEWLELKTIKSSVNYDKFGISLVELSKAANKFGIQMEILKGDFESFKKLKIDEPIISLIKNDDFLHYIIIEKITTKGNVIYIDPYKGKIKLSLNEFQNIFCNIVIICTKTSYSKIENKKTILFDQDYLKEKIIASFISIFITLLALVGSFYLKLTLDNIVPIGSFQKMFYVTICFLIIALIKIVLNFLNDMILQKIEIKYQKRFIDLYIDKLEKVRWEKINHMDVSDHLKNLDIMMKISSFKAKNLFSIITNSVCLFLSIIILILINIKIFLISILVAGITCGLTFIFKNKFKEIEIAVISKSMNFRKKYLSIINGIEQFKLNSTKNYLKNNFENSLEEIIDCQLKSSKTSYLFGFLQTSIKTIFPFIFVIFLVQDIWNNNMSVGQIFLFFSVFNFLIGPLNSLTHMIIEIPITKQYLENINSFFELENEYVSKNIISKIEKIKIAKIDFNFDSKSKKIQLSNLNVSNKTKITGKNGTGKSTLMKIISTLITSQKIEINGNNIDFYNLDSLRNQICFISNNDFLPHGTIYDFLRSQNCDSKLLLSNIEKYKLLDFFEMLGLSLHQHIEDGGNNFSAGQKQFISLMKIFSQDYSLFLFDESFENMDNEIIKKLFPILKKYLEDKIVIEISHRNNYIFKGKEIHVC